jgi:putative hydrolase of the HAD superfamily
MDETTVLVEIIRRSSRPLDPSPAGGKKGGDLPHPAKAVLFDLYGTLFIVGARASRSDDSIWSVASLLGAYGIDGDSASILRTFRERIFSEHARMRNDGVDFPEVRIEEVWKDVLGMENVERARRFAVEYECLVNPVWPMPHAQALIEELRDANVVLGIVSNAQFFTPLLFRAFFDAAELEMGFDEKLVLYSYLHGRAKPSLVLFQKARDVLLGRSILPENVLFVGNDEKNDIVPAFRTGFQTAFFRGDRRSRRTGDAEREAAEQEPAGLKHAERETAEPATGRRCPDLLVTSLAQLSEFLKRGPAGQDSSQRTS